MGLETRSERRKYSSWNKISRFSTQSHYETHEWDSRKWRCFVLSNLTLEYEVWSYVLLILKCYTMVHIEIKMATCQVSNLRLRKLQSMDVSSSIISTYDQSESIIFVAPIKRSCCAATYLVTKSCLAEQRRFLFRFWSGVGFQIKIYVATNMQTIHQTAEESCSGISLSRQMINTRGHTHTHTHTSQR